MYKPFPCNGFKSVPILEVKKAEVAQLYSLLPKIAPDTDEMSGIPLFDLIGHPK